MFSFLRIESILYSNSYPIKSAFFAIIRSTQNES